MKANNDGKNRVKPSAFTTTLLLVIVVFLLFNFNFEAFNAGAAPGPIVGEGHVGFIPKWVDPPPTLILSFSTNAPGAIALGQSVDLQSVVTGTAEGTINYHVWWDCPLYNNPLGSVSPSVDQAQIDCGDPDLTANTYPTCPNQILGNKCDGHPSTSGPPLNAGDSFRSISYTYLTAGTKRPIGIVERDGAVPAMGAATVIVAAAPVVSSTSVTVNNSNYCGSGVHADVNGTYSDPAGLDGNAYEVMINSGADREVDPNAGPPNATTGVNPAITPEWWGLYSSSILSGGIFNGFAQSCLALNNPIAPFPDQSSSTTVVSSCGMTWNTIYTAWARVRNSANLWSPWLRMSTYCNGGTYGAGNACNGGTASPPNPWPGGGPNPSWITPIHAFPQTGFTKFPTNPTVNAPVTFTDTTGFQGAAFPRTWLWDFNYPTGPTQTINSTSGSPVPNGNTTHTYTAIGTYSPRLTATDDLGQSCSYDLAPSINIGAPLPRWFEVAPR